MSTDTTESTEFPAPPDWSKLRGPNYKFKSNWGGLTPAPAFHEITSTTGSSSNYNCVVKFDEHDFVPVIVTGVREEWCQSGKAHWVMTEVLEARYATEEHYDRSPLSLFPHDILRQYPDLTLEFANERPAFEKAHKLFLRELLTKEMNADPKKSKGKDARW